MSNLNQDVLVIDYQIGNVSSVINAIKKLGHKANLSNNINSIENASHLILPGVGSFEAGMSNINRLELKEVIIEKLKSPLHPVVYISLEY